jgi:choline dehydrogenase-like flavoprotein
MTDSPIIPLGPVGQSAAEHPRCVPARSRLAEGVIKTEVCVVGTGAGGAVAGTELARAGKQVLFLEAGPGIGTRELSKHRDLTWSTQQMFASAGVQYSVGDPPLLIPSGMTVGGSTVLNSAICFRPPDERLEEWAAVGGAHLSPEAMAPIVDEIWQRIGVHRTHLGIGRRHNQVFADGVKALGWEGEWMDRNAPACSGCGLCHFGCPSGGKASVDKSILPEAMQRRAEILTRARVDGVIIEGGRARGVEVSVLGEDREEVGRLKVEADLVIVSGSALRSPVVLANSGVDNPHNGRHLSLHPAAPAVGEFEEPVVLWDGVPQGYWCHHPDDPGVTIETATAGPAEIFALFGRPGLEGAHEMLRFKHLAMSGGMIRDVGEGTVTPSDGGRPSISYDIQPADLARLKAGIAGAARIYFAAGAKRVAPLVQPVRFFDSLDATLAHIETAKKPADLALIYASHPHGTCRIGPKEGPKAGVVDGDGKVHGVEGLYVMDGSILPTTVGKNPQVSIMSVSLQLSSAGDLDAPRGCGQGP